MRIFIIILFFSSTAFSQNYIQGEITYRVSLDKSQERNVAFKDEKSQKVKDIINNSKDVNFTLTFNNKESSFEKNKEMSNDINKSINLTEILAGSNNLFYHNIDKKENLMAIDLAGKKYTVEYPIENWVLTKEKKIISGFLCFKAITENNKVIAWYAPEIALNHGPSYFNNLPGIILELKFDNLNYLAININFKKEQTVKIKKPKDSYERISYSNFKLKFGGIFDE